MKVDRIDHIGIVVNDLPAAIEFFLDLGLELEGKAELEGDWLGRIVGLEDVKTEFVMMRAPGGQTALEVIKFISPVDAKGIQENFSNTLGIRHITFAVDDIEGMLARLKAKGVEIFSDIYNYENMYKLCYIRGPEGIIIELAEEIK